MVENRPKSSTAAGAHDLLPVSEAVGGDAPSTDHATPKDTGENASGTQKGSDRTVIARRVNVVKTTSGLRISFGASSTADIGSDKIDETINLNISSQERKTLLEALSTKARQAGWDLDAGLSRLRRNQSRQQARPRAKLH